ncbi:MAG: hypothetical protein HGA23_05580, partial [Bacteroidales bacterium]|nr:hypothetical protein [Bacteroidales bacterium]
MIYLGLLLLLPILILVIFTRCSEPDKKASPGKEPPQSFVVHPEWSRNANIYEVNIRQYTPEGTFSAFIEHIPRLKKMGVDILWLMPVNPVGEKNRKGTLGSYYSISDYKGINKEFGTLDDFKKVVEKAHQEGMKVIIDWVANHTSWDHAWLTEHPDWYQKDSLGNIVPPYDWTDVAPLDFKNREVWTGMVDAMNYWIVETGIDGFRCDVAWSVPMDFWDLSLSERNAWLTEARIDLNACEESGFDEQAPADARLFAL